MPRFHRKIIRIRGADSPNVQYALAEIKAGLPVSNTILIPGVLPYADYAKRRLMWDKIRQTIGLDAEFWEGADVLMFPPLWMDAAERWADELRGVKRFAKAIGIDPAEGGDKTSMCAIDELGVVELLAKKTPDTNMIPGEAIAFMKKHNVEPKNVYMDRGGGGKQHADRMRASGWPIKTVAFGEGVSLPPKVVRHRFSDRVDNVEERVAYKNRRAQMYAMIRHLLDPGRLMELTQAPNEGEETTGRAIQLRTVAKPFGIPAEYEELRLQLGPIPLTYDSEQVLYLLPKNKRPGQKDGKTLTELIGHSPDEADSLALAVYGLFIGEDEIIAGGF